MPVFTQLPPGIYSVSVKGPHWLRRTFTDAIEITADGGRVDTPFQLINGDADEDNEVSIGDYALLSGGYGLSYGDAGWSDYDNADFNMDLSIDIADYAILSANYGQIGDD